MSYWKRLLDFYKLKPRYRTELSVFHSSGFFAGIAVSIPIIVNLGDVLGVPRGAPLGEVENGITYLVLIVMLLFTFMLGGLVIGAFVHGMYLVLTRRMNLLQALSATLLSKYPKDWFL